MADPRQICKAKRKYLPPKSLDYQNYFEHLGAFNEAILSDAAELFKGWFSEVEDTTICTTGSDSRLEKGPKSELELLLLLPEKSEKRNSLDDLKYLIKNCEGLNFDEDIELKYVEEGGLSETTIKTNESKTIKLTSPDRMIDCCYLAGSLYLYNRARKKFEKELREPKYGKKILRSMRDRLREHRNITFTGTQKYKKNILKHFDIETGEVFYNPKENAYGFKQGPLRAIQTSIVRDFVKEIRNENSQEGYFTCKGYRRPQGVVPKMNYLRVRDMIKLKEDDFKDLTDCYKYFLWGYHVSESCYHNHGTSVVEFEKKETKDRLDFVYKISKEQIIK
ncbi:MAG: hypothetical protein ACOCQG_03945 [Candidatus Nanoarchaeia archaeon]